MYFGWNLGLKDNGPVAMLVASLIVCLLYLTWVLALAELSVAMPFAGGPLAYGRRAGDPSLGFVMGWSMYLECQFASIATALAAGGYIAYLLAYPNDPSTAAAHRRPHWPSSRSSFSSTCWGVQGTVAGHDCS